MKKLSTIIERQTRENGFNLIGVNGYAGEQDGSRAILSDEFHFPSRSEADLAFPRGAPDYVELHWGEYHPGEGWRVVFGWWSTQPTEGDGNPFDGY